MDNVIVIYSSVDYFIDFFRNKNIKVYKLLKKEGLFLKLLRNIARKLNISSDFFFGEWKKEIVKDNIEYAIVFANNEKAVLNYLHKKNIKIIYFYWNPVKIYKEGFPTNLPDFCDKWSFDRNDCEKYNLKFNTTFYFDNIKLPPAKEEFDILFVGENKGRINLINNFLKQSDFHNLKNHIYVVSDRQRFGRYDGNQPISYNNYLNLLSKSKAILDIMQSGQEGLTLRVMEALFFKKKLITNNKAVLAEKFYCEENVFVIGYDDINRLRLFIDSKYRSLDENLMNYYDAKSWIERFFTKQEK